MIFAVLWLLQTVFLQTFYDRMTIRNAERAASEIADALSSGDLSRMDELASENSLLIFLTDAQGNVLYSADEHASLYEKNWSRGNGNNPYRTEERMGWQAGAFRNLPRDYSGFLTRLAESPDGTVGFATEDGAAYIWGAVLEEGDILYISTPLGAVGAAVGILRGQLLWVTALSLVLGFLMAWWFSGRFARPVAALSVQARHLGEGDFRPDYTEGFCAELDDLSGTLKETSQRLQRLENARRELLANVSHDLRTPLTMIKGYAEMVRDISWSDGAQREADLAVIIREADRLTGLVNDILEESSLRTGQDAGTRTPVDLSAAARAAAEQFAPLCARRELTLETDIQPGLWVTGDEKQLQRVLYNWLDNAIRHSGPGQSVRLSLKRETGLARAEVRDHGPGIAPENLPHIWDRYYTAEERRETGGTGLGLAITREILKRHSARFGVESQPGQGSLFWFTLETRPDET